ncbi:MAG: hypothetical protein QGG40_14970, partial [Myxococcota bacterium]|nr:hypothetical protein [Myxococcota bacterium]
TTRDTSTTDTDTDTDTGSTNTDTGEPPDPYADLTGAMRWVRTHPMMISGLVVQMSTPSSSEVSAYFNDFGANTLQLWVTGLPQELADWQSNEADLEWISWIMDDGTSATSGTALGGMGSDPTGRIAYQVGDEPGSLEDLQELEAGIGVIRDHDPDALVIVNFGNPDEGSSREAIVSQFASGMDGDIISYDQYSFQYTAYESMEVYRQVALEHGMPYWRYLNAFAYTGNPDDWPEESDMRWDAFKGLVYGFTGHTWFLYQVDPAHGLETSLFDETGSWGSGTAEGFAIAATINQEMANLGRAITQLTSVDVRYIPSVSWYAPDGTTDWSPGAGDDPYLTSIEAIDLEWDEMQDISVGFFVDDQGEAYVMVQNPTHAHSSWPIMVEEQADFRLEFDFSDAPSSLDPTLVQVLDKDSGDVESLTLQTLGGGKAALEFSLSAGDPLLFKYATGTDFALQ